MGVAVGVGVMVTSMSFSGSNGIACVAGESGCRIGSPPPKKAPGEMHFILRELG